MTKRLCAGLLALCAVFLCACGAATATSASGSQQSGPQSISAPPAVPESVPSQSLPPEDADMAVEPLTGLPKGEGYPEGTRPLAVMIDNVQAALPQRGLQAADIVYEMVTEGGITRLMAVYADYASMPQVGPVRSARDQHVQLMLPLQALYLHVGGSTYAMDMLARYEYGDKSINGYYQSGALELDSERNMTTDIEHCWFSSGSLFSAAAGEYGLETALGEPLQPVFEFVAPKADRRVLTGGEAGEVYVRFSSYANSAFSYDAARGEYIKSQFGAPHIDANTGEAVRFDNLLILFTDVTKYPGGVLAHVNFAYGGVGYYICGGQYEPVRWLKGAPEAPLRIVSSDGAERPVELNPGRTYVAMVDLGMYGHFRMEPAAGTADAEKAAGQP